MGEGGGGGGGGGGGLSYVHHTVDVKILCSDVDRPSGCPFISSPEHKVLMVSYCDQSMSVVRRASSVVRRQQFVLKANSS